MAVPTQDSLEGAVKLRSLDDIVKLLPTVLKPLTFRIDGKMCTVKFTPLGHFVYYILIDFKDDRLKASFRRKLKKHLDSGSTDESNVSDTFNLKSEITYSDTEWPGTHPKKVKPGQLVIGFDTAHLGDIALELKPRSKNPDATFKTLAWVKDDLRRMIHKLYN